MILHSCSLFKIKPRKKITDKKLSSLVLTGYGISTYTSESIETYLKELKDLETNTASFLYTCYVENRNDPNVDCDSYDSPRLNRLSDAIRLAKDQNFIVSLRVYVDLKDLEWRCHWNPDNKEQTFKSLNKTLKRVAKFSEEHQVELLIIGAEYCQLTTRKYTKEWKKIISTTRDNFNGKITYGANWGEVRGIKEWRELKFWPQLDYIGIDHYHPLPNKVTEKKIAQIQKRRFRQYQNLAQRLKKPLMITELGFPGHYQGHQAPFDWELKGRSDESRQAKNYKGTLKAINDVGYFKGVFIWRKESESKKKMLTYDKDALNYRLYKREAWYEIKNFFKYY